MKTFFKSIACLFLLFCSRVDASESQTMDRIITHENGVVILLDNAWVQVDAVQATVDGILVLHNGDWMPLPQLGKCNPNYSWQCKNCKAWNASCSGTCYNCKGPKVPPPAPTPVPK